MILISKEEFYREVVEGDLPIKDIFSSLAASLSSDDFNELFEKFTHQLDECYYSFKREEIVNSEIKSKEVPSMTARRVELSVLLLWHCVIGTSYNHNLYFSSVDYLLKKELCSKPLILN